MSPIIILPAGCPGGTGNPFSDNFETGDFSKWDYASPTGTPSIVASPAFGSFAAKITNGTSDPGSPFSTSNASGALKNLGLGSCFKSMSLRFNITARGAGTNGGDDIGMLRVLQAPAAVGTPVVALIPSREEVIDPTRSLWVNGSSTGVVLSTSTWYEFVVSNVDWNASTLDFVVRTYPGLVVTASGVGVSFSGTGANYLEFHNQFGGSINDSVGACVYDNIQIS